MKLELRIIFNEESDSESITPEELKARFHSIRSIIIESARVNPDLRIDLDWNMLNYKNSVFEGKFYVIDIKDLTEIK